MDFKLDNTNLGLNEKNKKLLQGMMVIKDQKSSKTQDEDNCNIDTFKMYCDFLTEKQAIIEIINEICEFSNICCGKLHLNEIKIININKITDLVNFKNRVIMIVNFLYTN
jgi:hypothetical protein